MNKIIDGKKLAQELRNSLSTKISDEQISLCLAVIIVGDNSASKIYVKAKEKACQEVGIKSQTYILDKNTTTEQLLELINQLNNDSKVNGILVQLPLPKHIDTSLVLRSIANNKDVDGFSPYNAGLLLQNKKDRLTACTPNGIIQLIKSIKPDLTGLNAVVVGRSNIVGLPVMHLLLQENCTVTVTHSKTKDLAQICKNADILVVAIGFSNFIDSTYIKQGAIVIDVGINRTANGLVGDVNFNDVFDKVSHITPVPGGVGPMTIANLLQNTYIASKLQKL